jgi:hypothetical protein
MQRPPTQNGQHQTLELPLKTQPLHTSKSYASGLEESRPQRQAKHGTG